MFSLRTLLAAVAVLAVYIAGMVYRARWWEASILTLTYIIYAGAIAAEIVTKERRVFFVTFSVFGVAYGWALHHGVAYDMLPNEVLSRMSAHISEDFASIVIGKTEWYYEPGTIRSAHFDRAFFAFSRIGHALFAVLLSFVAGAVAEALVRRRPLRP
jgi:hypothetical protein